MRPDPDRSGDRGKAAEDDRLGAQHEQIADAARHQMILRRGIGSTINAFDPRRLPQQAGGLSLVFRFLQKDVASTAEILVMDDMLVANDRDRFAIYALS